MTATTNGPSTAMRLSALAIVVLSLVGALTARLWVLTAIEGEASQQEATANSLRTIHIQAPRGRIMDRHKNILVDNVQVRQLRINNRELDESVAYDADDRTAIYQRLADALNLYEVPVVAKDVGKAAEMAAEEDGADEDEQQTAGDQAIAALATTPASWSPAIVAAALENNFRDPYLPTPVAEPIPEDLEVLLAENQLEYPGVDVEPVARRSYPHGTLAAHVLGYVKPLTPDDMADPDITGNTVKPYAIGDDIGQSGVELSYEDDLRGTPGERVLEVDAQGNVVQQVGYTAPVPGDDLMLALDIGIQAQLERALTEQAESEQVPGASGVVLDPNDGSIIAMASYPTYNPEELSGRVSNARYNQIKAGLSNRAISGQYPAGSTWKPVTAIAALRAGLMHPGDVYNDTGTYLIQGCNPADPGCTKHNPDDVPNYGVNLSAALTKSSDTYFYHLGDQLWGARDTIGETALQDVAHEFGFAEETGVDLPAAVDGSLWTPEIKRETVTDPDNAGLFNADEADWRAGDSVNMAIGQGFVQVTPLQLANMYSVFANGGTLHTPHVGAEVLRPHPERTVPDWDLTRTIAPDDLGTVNLPPQWRDPIMEGLLGVPRPGGTASEAFEGFDLAAFPIAGKTGTAQKDEEEDYGLFVGMGPVFPGSTPQYVVATVFEAGGQFGGTIAAPPVRAVFDGIYDSSLLPMIDTTPATPLPSTGELTAGAGANP